MIASSGSKDPAFDDPFAVSEHVLEVTRKAIFDGDSAGFTRRLVLPQAIGTFENDVMVETDEDAVALLKSLRTYLRSAGVLDFKRHTIAAEFLAPDLVQATFTSQHVLRGHVLSPEIVAHGTLRLSEGIWKIENSRYATPSIALSKALTDRGKD